MSLGTLAVWGDYSRLIALVIWARHVYVWNFLVRYGKKISLVTFFFWVTIGSLNISKLAPPPSHHQNGKNAYIDLHSFAAIYYAHDKHEISQDKAAISE